MKVCKVLFLNNNQPKAQDNKHCCLLLHICVSCSGFRRGVAPVSLGERTPPICRTEHEPGLLALVVNGLEPSLEL